MLSRWNGELFSVLLLSDLVRSSFKYTHKPTFHRLRLCYSCQDFELFFLFKRFEDSFLSATGAPAYWNVLSGVLRLHTQQLGLPHRPVKICNFCRTHEPKWSALPRICKTLSLLLSFASTSYCFTSLVVLSRENVWETWSQLCVFPDLTRLYISSFS